MAEREYIELNARSAFSFLQGASVPEEYVTVCRELGIPAIALVDRDGVYGAPRLHLAAKRSEGAVRGHIGATITCTDGGCYPLLAKSRTGYQNLSRLITRMKLRVPKHPKSGDVAAATPNELREHAEGLICLTGDDDGPLAVALKRGSAHAESLLQTLIECFGADNLYVELQRHGIRAEEERNEAVIQLARNLRLPVVATNGVRYSRPERREILDVLTCIHHKRTLDTAGRLLTPNAERYLKSAAAMHRIFADLPEAIVHTREISARLEFTMTDLGYRFPPYPVPAGETMDSYLRALVDEYAPQCFPSYAQRHRAQLNTELALIEKLGLAGYFLIVWDIVRFCKEHGILAQGRGSAGNSAVCFALGITAVDPIKYELLFERFLSADRGEWPDIDIDLPSGDEREQVIQYVYERYGRLGAAMCANVITYRGRSAIREVGKVLGFDEMAIGKLSSLSPLWEWKSPDDTIRKQFEESGLELDDPRVRKFFELVEAIQDLPRHLGQHSGGMIVCQGQLDSVVPLEPASMPNRVVVQWDKEDCADLGLIKIDLLGLGMMAVLRDTMALIEKHRGVTLTLATVPDRDPTVFEMLQRADTIGLFQIESRAQQASLPRTKPATFYDLVVQVAIIRPGPIVGRLMHPYIKRRQGKETPTCPHPSLEPVLRRTLGVPLFQEQLLKMAMVAANFSGSEAEQLRRAMGFKRSEARMKEIEGRLREGMMQNRLSAEAQETIVKAITSFALYGFPESHSISFALLAYASGYFKCHYLPEFLAALLNNQPMGFYAPSTLIKDAQRHGLRVLPIDINRSRWNCTIEEGKLRLGFRYARGLRAMAAQAIENRQPFVDIDDLARSVPALKKSELEQLAFIGALNSIGAANRRDALWQVARAGRPTGPLLDDVPEEHRTTPLEQMTLLERVVADHQGTGVTVGAHPLAHSRAVLNKLGVTPAANLAGLGDGSFVKVAGNVIVRQRPGTAAGVVFVSLEDETGICNLIVMPDRFEAYRVPLLTAPYLLAEGILQNTDSVIHVRVAKVEAFRQERVSTPSHDFR
jgi:error-prone DNA polymerase